MASGARVECSAALDMSVSELGSCCVGTPPLSRFANGTGRNLATQGVWLDDWPGGLGTSVNARRPNVPWWFVDS